MFPAYIIWCRDARNSNAEIDYLIEKDTKAVPVEVKSGSVGRMKSLQIFISEYQSRYALRISQSAYHAGKPVISFPFYGIESMMKAVTLGQTDNGGTTA